MPYINFTDEQKIKAHQTDIAALLISQGETVKRSGKEYEWFDGTQKVTVRGNLWYHQYERVGGDAVSFVKKFYNKNYADSVLFLLNESSGKLVRSKPTVKNQKPFEVPKPYWNMDKVKQYLHSVRGIDEDIIKDFTDRKMIYESSVYHNAVFIGFDKNGIPRHANMRGTLGKSAFKGNAESSLDEFAFHYIGTNNRIYLFEAPIDMLSFISMHKENWKAHSYAASCSVSDRVLFQCLKDYPHIEKVYICFDNDKPGQTAANRISDKLNEMKIQSKILVPRCKDWNEVLLCEDEESEVEEICQALVL